jgi:TatD DNase family protein
VLLDCHAHLDHFEGADLERALEQIAERRILTIGVSMDPQGYERSLQIASQSPFVVPALGVHPWNAPRHAGDLPRLEDLVAEAPMIGEIGLDHHFVDDPALYHDQLWVFEYFLAKAAEQNKTVNVHTKGAEADVVAAMRRFRPPRVIVHWYSGPIAQLDELVESGAFFTVGVEIMSSDEIRRVAREIPADRLLTETDAPGAGRWLSGVAGMPADLEGVVDTLAAGRGLGRRTLESLVRDNFLRLVDDDPHLGACPQMAALRRGS